MLRAGRGVMRRWQRALRGLRVRRVLDKYREFTIVPRRKGIANLLLCIESAPPTGCVVECGVWRGGMSAAMADVMPGRQFFLFDSFEGLPPPKAIDGKAAFDFQRDAAARSQLSADASFAELVKGWFSDTLPGRRLPEPIAVLRLDGDWYESTMDCLKNLYPQVMPGGLIILDDYFTYDGCSRAVHDYLSMHKTSDRIHQFKGVPYIIKRRSDGTAA